MSEELQPQVEGLDPLDVNCDDIDISYPDAMPGIYHFRIVKAAKQQNKNKDGEIIVVQLKSLSKIPRAPEGRENIEAGYELTHNIALTPRTGRTDKKDYTNKEIAEAVTRVVKAVGMLGVKPREVIQQPAVLQGKEADVRLGFSKPTDEYPDPRTEIKSFIIPNN